MQAVRRDWRINTERAIALSVILHLLLLLALLTIKLPERSTENQADPLGIIALMKGTPPDPAIPIQFFPAPGPRAAQPGPKPLPSDMNRQAHGGDQRLPVQPVPKAYPQAGIRDLEAGRPGPSAAAAPKPPQVADASAGSRPLGDLAPGASMSDPPTLTERENARRLRGLPPLDLNSISAQDARRAAQQAGGQGGEGGGGYDRDGGFVDSGPLSFDTAGYDWGAYAAEMIRKIKRNWDVPALARYGVKGRLTIRFYINKDGHVDGERILSNSGVPPFDNAAFLAIAHASPFRALPSDLGHDREGVTVTFFYNIRPEDVESAGRR
ncbi:MAG TPA: TonB family protein [Thermoanaerobaculia bacterium]|nr:TonB family protein [Thermoanaerobaculia bacterium]